MSAQKNTIELRAESSSSLRRRQPISGTRLPAAVGGGPAGLHVANEAVSTTSTARIMVIRTLGADSGKRHS